MPDSSQDRSPLEALCATVPLGRLPRTGWLMSGVPYPESIAAHSHGVCLVVLALGPAVEPPIDVDRAVSLAAVHDVPEALLSDLPRPGARLFPAGAKRIAETAAALELLSPLSSLAHARFEEYAGNESREARFARLCDRLHLGVMLVAYLRAGARGLEDFMQTMTDLDVTEFPACQELLGEILEACGEIAP
ncbi:MAG: putative hydrolase of HD superfamily [Planctomycetota bacterium]|jgi:putative hydrolase of HD superfamily